jgi:AHBA synthesis associated protein
MSEIVSDSRRAPRAQRVRTTVFRAVVFDLDGVLVNSLPVMAEAFSTAYREVVGDGEPPFEEYCRHLGRYFPDIMRAMSLPLEMYEPFVRESNLRADRLCLYEDVDVVLRRLRRTDLKLAIATGKSGERASACLERLGVRELFDIVRGGDEVARPKPAPDVLLSIVDELGLECDEVLFVGDACADEECARAAGVAFAAAAWGDGGEELLGRNPDFVLDVIDDVESALAIGDV